MTDTQPTPPRWARALLEAFLKPSDVESIPGDLLEEYREVRRPSLGRVAADVWFVRQVLSVLWPAVWPSVIAVVALRTLVLLLAPGWNASLIPAPYVSLADALIYLCIGSYGAWKTGRVTSGMLVSALTSILTFPVFFVYAAVRMPDLLLAPFEKPFIFVIVLTLFAISVTFGVVVGTVGAVAGRRLSHLAAV
jgi:hypothetical protein